MTRVGRRGLILGPVTIKDGAAAPVNTVAPAIASSAVIGTALNVTPGTWTGSPVLTYQWQRNTGSWVNISGATNTSYTPVDADFGRALRVVETADGSVSANSNETGLTAEAPVQSLGAELLTNGDMETGNPPTGWTAVNDAILSAQTLDPYAGTQYLRVTRGTNNFGLASQAVGTNGTCCEISGVRRSDGVASTYPANRSGVQFLGVEGSTNTTWNVFRLIEHVNTNGPLALLNQTSGVGSYSEFDSMSVKQIALNAQLTAPSANMRLTQFYTLPGSPVAGDTVWVMPRVSNFGAGNYWLISLRYTGSQWNINLYSVATYVRTSRIAATNIGETNGIRVTANGDDWTLETTANGGTNWTSRGTVNNNLYNTSTGVNSLWTSSVTIGNLAYEVP